jgi:hypothetical protein
MEQVHIVGPIAVDSGTLHMFADICQIGLFLASIAAALFAYFSLRELRNEQRQHLQIAKASFLMEIDLRWDSEEIRKARRMYFAIGEDIKKIIAEENLVANDSIRQQKYREKWREALSQNRKADLDNYITLMALCGFFETVGLMVSRDYVKLDEIDALLRGPILGIDDCFRDHIKDRCNEMGVPNGLYEHALKLCDSVKAIQK